MRSIYVKEKAEPVDHFRLQYSIKSAARMLDVGTRTLEGWINSFQIPTHTIADQGKRFISHVNLVAFIEKYSVYQQFASQIYDQTKRV